MKRLIPIILFLLPIALFSQVGIPANAFVEGCDTLRKETVWVKVENGVACDCYEMLNGIADTISCNNVVPGTCENTCPTPTGAQKCALVKSGKGSNKIEVQSYLNCDNQLEWRNCKTNEEVINPNLIDCECDYSFTFQKYCTSPNNIEFYLQREIIRDCEQEGEGTILF